MNLRSLMCVLGAVGMLGFSTACEIKEGTSSGTSDGGNGGDGGSGDGGAGVGGAGGAGGMAACYAGSCAEFITLNPEEEFCADNPAKELYDTLSNCTCDLDMNPATMSPCAEACKDEACAEKDIVSGGACQKCITDTNMGCGKEFNACSNG